MVIYFCKINTYSISAPTLFFFFYVGGGKEGKRKKMDEAEQDRKVEGASMLVPALLGELLTHLN